MACTIPIYYVTCNYKYSISAAFTNKIYLRKTIIKKKYRKFHCNVFLFDKFKNTAISYTSFYTINHSKLVARRII